MTDVDDLPLRWLEVLHDAADPVARHAADLLMSLGATVSGDETIRHSLRAVGTLVTVEPSGDVIADWAESGVMWLTGPADGPPLLPPGAGATAARGAAAAFELLTALAGQRVSLDGHRLLGEHAATRGLTRQGTVSPGGAFRIVEAADGPVGFTLARQTDRDLVPALVGSAGTPGDQWCALTGWARRVAATEVVERAHLLGLAATLIPDPEAAADDEQSRARGQRFPLAPLVIDGRPARPAGVPEGGDSPAGPRRVTPLVVDLSSLWAGPLCAHLLGLAGAEVVKVESLARPDGARSGPSAFFDLMHAGHRCVAVDLQQRSGVEQLRRLIARADVVIEASRPRAMEQLGIDPADVLAASEDATWLSITAYGRTGPWADRVGYGDDAAVAAGLVASMPGDPRVFSCGDAIADPLTGLHAAVAALAAVLGGGRRLIEVALRDVVGSTLAERGVRAGSLPMAVDTTPGWIVESGRGTVEVAAPAMRDPAGRAAPLGADSVAVFEQLGLM